MGRRSGGCVMIRFVILAIAVIVSLGPGLMADIKRVIADHSAETLYKNHMVFHIYTKVMLYCCVLIWGNRFLLP